jgi:hypothetical protein
MHLFRLVVLAAIFAASAVAADPLAAMAGTWQGTGWARETPQGPQETVRCRITNSYDAPTLTLVLSGRCVVPGRQIAMSGRLTRTQDAERVTGRWYNPDGIGSVAVRGIMRGDSVAFTFSAKDPETGRDLAQNVEWRVMDNALRLRATDRADPRIAMSEISFVR